MPFTNPVNTTRTGNGGANPSGPQPGGGFIIPIIGSLLNDNPNYQLIFEIVTLSKNDLEIIQHSNHHRNDLMNLPIAFIAVEIIESNLPPVPAINIDPTALDVVIGELLTNY